MTDWFPISTAPKDGTMVYLKLRDGLGEYSMEVPCVLIDRIWYNSEDFDAKVRLLVRPTHWRSIPPK